MKRREDGAVREVMKELLRSDLRFHKTDCGRFGAMTAWGLKDTSSRPAKDLGGTLRHTIRTVLRSYDSRASGDRNVPIVRARGKCDEHKPNYHTAAVPISRLAYPLNFIGAAAFLYELRQNVSSYLMKKQFLTGGASIWISRLPLRPPTKR